MTAIAGQHYRQAGGVIEFADGETSKLIEIDFYQDTIFDGREKAFNLELSNPLGLYLIYAFYLIHALFVTNINS